MHTCFGKPNSTPKWFMVPTIKAQQLDMGFSNLSMALKPIGPALCKTRRSKVPETTYWKVLSGPVISCEWMAASREARNLRSIQWKYVPLQSNSFHACLQVGWKGNPSFNQPFWTILPTNCRNHTERLRPLEFWSVPECKICPCVCREGSRNFQNLEFFMHGCII